MQCPSSTLVCSQCKDPLEPICDQVVLVETKPVQVAAECASFFSKNKPLERMAKPYWCSNPDCKTKAPGKSKSVFDSINWRCRGCHEHVHLGRGLKHARDMIGRHIYTCFRLATMIFAADTMSACDKIVLEGAVELCNQKFAAKEYLKQGLPFLATSASDAHGCNNNGANGFFITPPDEVARALSASDKVVLRCCIELCKHNLAAGEYLEQLLASSASSSTNINTNAGRRHAFNCEDEKSHSFSSGHEEEASVLRAESSLASNAPPNVTAPESNKRKRQKEGCVRTKVEGAEQRGDKGKRKKNKNKAPSKGEPAATISPDVVSACSEHQGTLTPELHTEVSDFFRDPGEEPNLLRGVQPGLPVDAGPQASSGVQTLMSGMGWAPTNLEEELPDWFFQLPPPPPSRRHPATREAPGSTVAGFHDGGPADSEVTDQI